MHFTANNYHKLGNSVVGWQNWRNGNGTNNSVEWIF